METVTAAMINRGVKRLLVLSVAFLFDDAGFLASVLGGTVFRNIRRGSQEMEEVVQNSGWLGRLFAYLGLPPMGGAANITLGLDTHRRRCRLI